MSTAHRNTILVAMMMQNTQLKVSRMNSIQWRTVIAFVYKLLLALALILALPTTVLLKKKNAQTTHRKQQVVFTFLWTNAKDVHYHTFLAYNIFSKSTNSFCVYVLQTSNFLYLI